MVFPLHDDNSRVSIVPSVTWGLILLNCLIFFLWEFPQSSAQLQQSFFRFGVVPQEYTLGVDLPPTIPLPYWTTLFTMMFIHGNIAHLFGNMIYLWIFVDNVEQEFGHLKFFLFYILCGMFASILHIWFNPDSYIPSVGASGAISGILAAYMLMFPRERVVMASFFGLFTMSAMIMIVFWIGFQLINAVASIAAGSESSGIAYIAHLGGFLAGIPLTIILMWYNRHYKDGATSA